MIIFAKPVIIHENRCDQAQPRVCLLFHILVKRIIVAYVTKGLEMTSKVLSKKKQQTKSVNTNNI